jgi:hypothetical protein
MEKSSFYINASWGFGFKWLEKGCFLPFAYIIFDRMMLSGVCDLFEKGSFNFDLGQVKRK